MLAATALAIILLPGHAQKLLDRYKSGTAKLVADTDYAKGNDWDEIFRTYYDTIYNKPMGERKSLKMMPDGSVIVNHEYRDFFSKFSSNGQFEREFSATGKVGVQKKYNFEIKGVINNNTFFTDLDRLGNMLLLDFDGNYKKKLKLDYMSSQMIALPNNKVAVVGWVLWQEKNREFISIIDCNSGEQHDIWERFLDRKSMQDYKDNRPIFHYTRKLESGGLMSFTSMPFANMSGFAKAPKIASIGDNLMIAIPATGEILIYDLEGNPVDQGKIDWNRSSITVDEQKEIQRKAIEKLKDPSHNRSSYYVGPQNEKAQWESDQQNAIEQIIPQMEEDLENVNDPIPLPYFSTIIKDSDDNVLFFEYPKEKGQNKFNVWIYNKGGEFLCQSRFVCDDYDLQINPDKLVFHNGYIYGLQIKKNVSGVPLRLVRFKLE